MSLVGQAAVGQRCRRSRRLLFRDRGQDRESARRIAGPTVPLLSCKRATSRLRRRAPRAARNDLRASPTRQHNPDRQQAGGGYRCVTSASFWQWHLRSRWRAAASPNPARKAPRARPALRAQRGQRRSGPQGAAGAPGPAGPAGPAGAPGRKVLRGRPAPRRSSASYVRPAQRGRLPGDLPRRRDRRHRLLRKQPGGGDVCQ